MLSAHPTDERVGYVHARSLARPTSATTKTLTQTLRDRGGHAGVVARGRRRLRARVLTEAMLPVRRSQATTAASKQSAWEC